MAHDKWSMPVTRPQYVDPYLEGLVGPNEQHEGYPDSHCANPKCPGTFGDEDIYKGELP